MRPTVTVVGLGPAGPELITAGTLQAIEAATSGPRFLRTSRHPAASAFVGLTSCDDIYERAASFDEVYADIVTRIVDAATEHGHALYAVPGSPAVAERTVELLRTDERVDVVVLPAMSFVDLAWVRLGVDPLRERPRIVDGHRFALDVAGDLGPFLVTQCHSDEILSTIKLAFDDHLPTSVTVIARLGLPDEHIEQIVWNDLDRVAADHLTSLWIPRLGKALGGAAQALEGVMCELRAQCPWDRQQTHLSLARYITEEAAELVEAIEALAPSGGGEIGLATDAAIDHFADELGDVAFQVVFHACLAAEQGWFTFADVLDGLAAKLVRRHPHVFPPAGSTGDEWKATTAEEVRRAWVNVKAAEKSNPVPFLRP